MCCPSVAAAAFVTAVQPATRSTITVRALAAAATGPASTARMVAVTVPAAGTVALAVVANTSPANEPENPLLFS